VLLSHHSMESHNVIKEVSLASEKRKQIFPIELHTLTGLSDELQYQLAGIQRSSIANVDSVVKVLESLGMAAGSAPSMRLMQEVAGRKSLMILPFEDLSPEHDHRWFTDGMTSELITALTNVKALRLIDWNTSREFRDRQVRTADLARELQVRYFIEGQVRKVGDQLKVSVTLLDIESGEHLWQDSLKGTVDDVFEIQEQVAAKVVKGLELQLSVEEQKKLQERGTESSEAYAHFLKAREYSTKEGRAQKQKALEEISLALELDPNFAKALHEKAHGLMITYYVYGRDRKLLDEAEELAQRALEIKHDFWPAYGTLAMIYLWQGRTALSEDTAKEYVRLAPHYHDSHAALGQFYTFSGQDKLAIESYERSMELRPDNYMIAWNIVGAAQRLGDRDRVVGWSRRALPLLEQRLRLAPDDEHHRVQYVSLLERAGQPERAIEAMQPMLEKADMDPVSLYNLSALLVRLGRKEQAIQTLNRALDAGLNYPETFKTDKDLDPLRDMPEFDAILERVSAQPVR
jgi:adenylate cyclase